MNHMTRRSFAICALALSLALSFTAASAQTPDPISVVQSFYDWLMGNQQNWTDLSGAKQYLTPSLYTSLQEAIEKQQSEKTEIFKFNPFVDSQVEADSYSISQSSGNGTMVTVPVRLRFPKGSQPGIVHVVVVRSSAGWGIDNFVYPDNSNLRKTLRDALK